MVEGILSPLHYRTTKLASKVLSRDQIGKTPSDVKAATIIAPAVTAHCFSIFRPVPLSGSYLVVALRFGGAN